MRKKLILEAYLFIAFILRSIREQRWAPETIPHARRGTNSNTSFRDAFPMIANSAGLMMAGSYILLFP